MSCFADGGKLVVPEAWKLVLKQIQGYFPQAQIAGGALRDLWHGKPAKDVDVFVTLKECDDSLYEKEILSIDPYAEIIASSIYGQTAQGGTPGFRNIYVIWRLNIEGVIYEIIFIEDRGEDLISVFDISLCQIGFDGNSVRTTAEFNKTIFDGVVRVCNTNRKDRQVKRLQRVMDKYPEYTTEPGALIAPLFES